MDRSIYDITELGWENGQPLKHQHGGIFSALPTWKPTWGTTDDTLDAIVYQATYQNINLPEFDKHQHHHQPDNNSILASSSAKKSENSRVMEINLRLQTKKRARSSEYSHQNNLSSYKDVADATIITGASPGSLKTRRVDEDSTCHAGSGSPDGELEERREEFRSHSSRRSRVAAVHNLSERKRRDRINQKMKTLQQLVPNANKTDKASMLDEVIEHLKQLQAQVEMMSRRTIPQMVMPLGMQQQLQMSLLEMNTGSMLDMTNLAQPHSPFIHPNSSTMPTTPQCLVSPVIPPQASTVQGAANTNPVPYNAFVAQSMNVELYNKMAAVYQQQVNQAAQTTNATSNSNHVQGE